MIHAQGAVEQLHTYTRLTGQSVTAAAAWMVLKALGSSTGQGSVTLNAVLEAAATYYGVSLDDLASRKRTKLVAHARQVAMYLARSETNASLPQIGDALGGRDHSTIVHGCARINTLLETDSTLAGAIQSIRGQLHAGDTPQAVKTASRSRLW